MSTTTGNRLTTLSREDILQNHDSVMVPFGIFLSVEDIDLSKLFVWILVQFTNPMITGFVDCTIIHTNAGSVKCSTKTLSQILTRILTVVKKGFQMYSNIAYATGDVNQM